MTKAKMVNGFITDGGSVKAAEVKIRLAKNRRTTISFEVDGILIGADFEEVVNAIKEINRGIHKHNTGKVRRTAGV